MTQTPRLAPLNILIVAAEMTPFVKTGGLADVIGALPQALHAAGHDVRVAIPKYGWIDDAHIVLQPLLATVDVPIADGIDQARVQQTKHGDVPVWFVAHDAYFDREGVSMYDDDDRRFVFFCRATLEATKQLEWQPDIVHCHDWHTAMIPHLLRTVLQDDPWFQVPATLLTIHNLAFQGVFGHRVLEIAGVPKQTFEVRESDNARGTVPLLAGGIYYADIINTVSPSYAMDILEPHSGEGLDELLQSRRDRVYGVLNGIDTAVYDPQHDTTIPAVYGVDTLAGKRACKRVLQEELGLAVAPDAPLLVMVSRLTTLKGFDVVDALLEELLQVHGVQMVIMGTGQQRFHARLNEIRARYPAQIAFRLTFEEALARRMIAGADMYLMPSRVEPCGTAQMIAMRYGTVPVVHATGGLKDTVRPYNPMTNEGNGFVCTDVSEPAVLHAIGDALAMYAERPAQWRQLMVRGMMTDFSWHVAASHYVDLYRRALTAHHPYRERIDER